MYINPNLESNVHMTMTNLVVRQIVFENGGLLVLAFVDVYVKV